MQDVIFEGFPNELAMEWTEKFLSAISVGISEEQFTELKHKLAIKRFDRLIDLQTKNLENNELLSEILSCLNLVKRCHEAELNKNYCDWSAAESAAYQQEANDFIQLLSELN